MITYFFRKRIPGQNSIEELFYGIIEQLKNTLPVQHVEVPEKSASPRGLWKNIRFARKNQTGINHITGDVHYLAMGLGKNTVLTLHDIGSGLKGSWWKRIYFRIFWLTIPAYKAARITVISNTSKNEVLRWVPFAKDKIRVIYNPYRQELLNHQKSTVPEKEIETVLLMGTKSNKNLERAFEALKGLNIQLIVVGKLTEEQQFIIRDLKLNVEEKSNLSFQEVIQVYLKTDLLFFPSLYEGFGMPIIEAQVLGVPVITSNTGAMKEVAGEGAHLVNPYSVAELREALQKVMDSSEYRQHLVAKGKENVKRFEPGKIAEQYMEVYRELP